MLDGICVQEVAEVSEGLVTAIARLVRQLSESAAPPSSVELEEIVASPASRLLVARDHDGTIVATLTLIVFRIPTGVRAWIEDVVVDRAARGRAVGQALVIAALRVASESGARTVELTSRPSRTAANRLYMKMGFRPRETTVYRFERPSG